LNKNIYIYIYIYIFFFLNFYLTLKVSFKNEAIALETQR